MSKIFCLSLIVDVVLLGGVFYLGILTGETFGRAKFEKEIRLQIFAELVQMAESGQKSDRMFPSEDQTEKEHDENDGGGWDSGISSGAAPAGEEAK